MKKNWITKVAVLMLALVMVTSCFVGSTFAKYVTRAQGTDQARVAKWGILVSVEGNAFANKYETDDDTYDGEFSVVAIDEAQVVAPGTNSEQVGQNLVGKVTGTPEVATRYTLEGKAVKDVVLPAGTYTDYTNYYYNDDEFGTGYNGTFTIPENHTYAPVKWNLIIEGKGQTLDLAQALHDALGEENLAQAEAYGFTENGCSIFDAIVIMQKVMDNPTYMQTVENILGGFVSGGRNFQLEADKDEGTFKLSYDFDPNKEMDYTFTLSWDWAFETKDDNGNVIELFDQADTFLGNVAAGVIDAPDGCSVEISAELTATATQID